MYGLYAYTYAYMYVCTYVHVYLVQKWRLTSCFGVDMAGVASSLDTVYIRIRVHTYTYAYTYTYACYQSGV